MPENYAYFFKSFAHSSRNEILRLLADRGEVSVENLASAMDIADSTVSRHLGALKMQRVVRVRREGVHHYYSLDRDRIREVFDRFLAFLDGQPVPSPAPVTPGAQPMPPAGEGSAKP